MRNFTKRIIMSTLVISSSLVANAAPASLMTHNQTHVESNAYIDGVVKSPYPSAPMKDNRVAWLSVRIACTGHIVNNKCRALVKMATETATPIDLGWLEMDMVTGEITPQELHNNGYGLIVNGLGDVTLIEE